MATYTWNWIANEPDEESGHIDNDGGTIEIDDSFDIESWLSGFQFGVEEQLERMYGPGEFWWGVGSEH